MDMSQFPPSNLLSYPDPSSDFDYGAFLHAPDIISFTDPASQQQQQQQQQQHLAQLDPGAAGFSDSSGKAATPTSDHLSSSGTTDVVVAPRPSVAQQRQRAERRGHTKSRRGCYNCKRRRIKCQETRPACGHCVKTGLKCEYPSLPQITHQPHHQIPLFSLQDMRFFQHFLTQCYPLHPLRQEEIWTHEIPSIAHNHEFLMHALLGFAASELIPTDPSCITAAMTHRVKAIKAIKRRLAEASRSSTDYEEANAMVATCYALTFQSVSLEDGMAEYMTFIRGIVIVGIQMMFGGIKPIFNNMFDDDREEILAPVMETLPLIEKGWVDGAREAIANLRPLCTGQLESEYADKLMNTVDKLYINSYDAYKESTKVYGWWMLLPHETFQRLINPNSQVMLLLHAHWISLTQIMAFILEQEREVRQKHPSSQNSSSNDMDPGFIRWLKYVNARIDYEHQMYNQWPMWVDEQLDKDMTFFGRRLG